LAVSLACPWATLRPFALEALGELVAARRMPCLGCVWKKPKVTETGTATLNYDRDGLDEIVATRPQQAVDVTTTTTPCCREGIDGDVGFGCLGCSRSPFLGPLGFCAVDWENALIFEAEGLECQYLSAENQCAGTYKSHHASH
jgi:hypothetical protein